VIALAVALAAVGSLTLLPSELDASSSCLPSSLKSRIAQINQKFGRVSVISTYRRGARMPSGRRSFHASCQAVDFKPPSGKYAQVAGWLKANHGGGVGTYSCGLHHIHIDSGPRVRFHSCQRAMVIEEMDGEAPRAAKSRLATAPGQGRWPVLLPAGNGPARL
jgi:hypothetical protein